jgi:uncharacterized membrane-anchored protein
MKEDDTIGCYCFNPECSNSIYRYKTTAITYLPLALALSEEVKCTKCRSVLKSKIDLEIEEQIRELLHTPI